MRNARILVHSNGDKHMPEAVNKAVIQAVQAGYTRVRAIDKLPEALKQLVAEEVDLVISTYDTRRVLALANKYLQPLCLRDPATGRSKPYQLSLAAIMPTVRKNQFFALADAGAQVNPLPSHSFCAGLLALHMMQKLSINHGRNLTVGVLGIGEERSKLSKEAKQICQYFERTTYPVRPVEPKEAMRGEVAVLVGSGEALNIYLKSAEAMAEGMGSIIKQEFRSTTVSQLAGLLSRKVMSRVKGRLYHSHSFGALVLGGEHDLLKGHGRSTADEMLKSILYGHDLVGSNISRSCLEATRRDLQEFAPELLP